LPSFLPVSFVSRREAVTGDPELATPSFDLDSHFGMIGPNSLVVAVPLSDPASTIHDSEILVKRPGVHVYSKAPSTRDSVGDPFAQLVSFCFGFSPEFVVCLVHWRFPAIISIFNVSRSWLWLSRQILHTCPHIQMLTFLPDNQHFVSQRSLPHEQSDFLQNGTVSGHAQLSIQ
jgi:hypothetical protein